MEKLNPEKLHVEFRSVTPTETVIGRKYTLTHSDETAELFLVVDLEYAYDKITKMRDEVLAEWRIHNECVILYVHVHVDGNLGEEAVAVRNTIFRRELSLALEAIRYGDRELFMTYPELDDKQILIHFYSKYPEYNCIENWGTPNDYK